MAKLGVNSSESLLDLTADASKKATPTYQPKNMDPSQISLESGGKQFDKDGQPLLGRYRDGTAPKKSERAYGVGQIQIGTARETARKHNIPWDESKLLNDADYNLKLADLHKGDLLTRYNGDKTLALAAYHSGSGNVDKAVAIHGRANFTQGLGPEGRNYVRKLAGEGGNGSNQRGTTMPVAVNKGQYADAKPAKAPDTTSEGGGGKADAFSLDGKARVDAARVGASASTLDEVFRAVSGGIQRTQEDNRQLLEAKAATNEVLLAEQAAETQARMDQLRPIFARREAIAARQVEVQDMGFFERTFAGLFNRNYDPEYLSGLDEALQGQIAESTLEWQTMSQSREQLGNILNERYTDEAGLNQLLEKNLLQDLGLAQTGHGIAATQLAATMTGIETDLDLLRGQKGLKDEALTGLVDTSTLNTLIAKARANPDGTVLVNGVPLTEAELITHGRQIESKDAQYELLQLSIANGKTALIEATMDSYIKSMTPTERAAAAQNGGIDPKTGQQLDAGKLVEYIGIDQQLAGGAVGANMESAAAEHVYRQVQTYGKALAVTNERYAQIFGRQDNPMTRLVNQQTDTINTMLTQLNAMPEGPAKVKQQAQVNTLIAQMNETQKTTVAESVKQYTKDAAGQALIGSYIQGQDVTPELATKGFIGLVRGGATFPKLDPRSPVAPVIAAMSRAVQDVYDQNGGQATVQQILANPKDKVSAGQMELKLMTAVKQAASSRWLNNTVTDFIDQAPAWAKADGHAAGRIRQADLRAAQLEGDKIGFNQFATMIPGWTPSDLATVVGPKGQGTAAALAKKHGLTAQTVNEWRSMLRVQQTQGMIQYLDSSESAVPGFRPSLALADFMRSNQFQGRANAYSANTGRLGLAEKTVTDIVGGPTLGATTSSYARQFADAAAQNDAVSQQQAVKKASLYKNDPMVRTKAIISSLEGFDPASEKILTAAVGEALKTTQRTYVPIGDLARNALGNPGATMDEINQATSQIIQHGKFEDPMAESLRRKAAAQWIKSSSAVDRALQALD